MPFLAGSAPGRSREVRSGRPPTGPQGPRGRSISRTKMNAAVELPAKRAPIELKTAHVREKKRRRTPTDTERRFPLTTLSSTQFADDDRIAGFGLTIEDGSAKFVEERLCRLAKADRIVANDLESYSRGAEVRSRRQEPGSGACGLDREAEGRGYRPRETRPGSAIAAEWRIRFSNPGGKDKHGVAAA